MPRGRRDEDDITRPTKATVSGRAFLALQREAKTAGRTTAEYLRLYALEGFLLRLAHSPYEDKYGGVRIRLVARLASAREPFHVDVNIGDPIWPEPAEIWMPRLLGQEPIQLRGYPMEMVLAEKIVTALQRGSASTRWRDFGDIFTITGRLTFKAGDVRQALQAVAQYRHVELANLDAAVEGYAEIGQPRWIAWRRKLQLTGTLPEHFGHALQSLKDFANPVITGSIADPTTWDPVRRTWNRAD
jgi:Nucleotidyl transferase AbiEii toxin, Type IV TA system